VKVSNALELTGWLARSDDAQKCLVRHWFRYALRRREVDGDEPSIRAVQSVLSLPAHDMREALVSLTRTAAFTRRTPSPGEAVQ
jgi:hypothetical protein